MIRYFALTFICLLLAACASASRDVMPINMPMQPYVKLTCEELRTELEQVSDQITVVSKRIDETSIGSRLAMGVGVVFWPALFLIDGKGDAQDELARLKGEKISIEDAMLERDCEREELRATRDDANAPIALPIALPDSAPTL